MRAGKRAATGAASAAIAVLATVTLAGCDFGRAVDCARLAVEVTEGVNELEDAALTADPDEIEEAADRVRSDIQELRDDVDESDVRDAADSVEEAVDNVRAGVVDGESIDWSPLGDATESLTEVCAP